MQVLISGANRGLGLGFVRALLARGERVIACCRHPGRATALNALTGEYPGHLHVLPLDVVKASSMRELAHEIPLVAESIDVLINNAGVLVGGERFGALDPEALATSFRINAMGPLLLTEALAERLADGARVANLSSVMGSIASTGEFRSPSYALSKAAQNMATVQLAHALAPRGIIVAALHPGWVRTEMGGEKASVAVEDAVAGLLGVIDRLSVADSGHFLDWRGQALPW
jgi:NAD(P)-dependent dehydrogenase (short-subunit alcohol dehydrogenase family)